METFLQWVLSTAYLVVALHQVWEVLQHFPGGIR